MATKTMPGLQRIQFRMQTRIMLYPKTEKRGSKPQNFLPSREMSDTS